MINERDFDDQIKRINNRIKLFNFLAWISVVAGGVILCIGFDLWINKNAKYNEIGDFIGGVAGALWALSGLFFIYIAFLGQKVQIKYQQEDLILTRQELVKTKEVFKQQTQIMSSQQLDNTFFNLLDNHRKLVESFKKGERNYNSTYQNSIMSSNYNLDIVSGYEVLDLISSNWEVILIKHSKFHQTKKVFDFSFPRNIPLEIIYKEKDIKTLYEETLGILEFIDKKILAKEKYFYFQILSNNLSFSEKYLIEVYHSFFGKVNLPFSFNQFVESEYCNLKSNLPIINFFKKSSEFSFKQNLVSNREVQYQSVKYDIFEFINDEMRDFKVTFITTKEKVREFFRINNIESAKLDIVRDFNLTEEDLFNILEAHPKINECALVLTFKIGQFTYFLNFSLDISIMDDIGKLKRLRLNFCQDYERDKYVEEIFS